MLYEVIRTCGLTVLQAQNQLLKCYYEGGLAIMYSLIVLLSESLRVTQERPMPSIIVPFQRGIHDPHSAIRISRTKSELNCSSTGASDLRGWTSWGIKAFRKRVLPIPKARKSGGMASRDARITPGFSEPYIQIPLITPSPRMSHNWSKCCGSPGTVVSSVSDNDAAMADRKSCGVSGLSRWVRQVLSD